MAPFTARCGHLPLTDVILVGIVSSGCLALSMGNLAHYRCDAFLHCLPALGCVLLHGCLLGHRVTHGELVVLPPFGSPGLFCDSSGPWWVHAAWRGAWYLLVESALGMPEGVPVFLEGVPRSCWERWCWSSLVRWRYLPLTVREHEGTCGKRSVPRALP